MISIHALLAESDGVLGRRLWHRKQFLSTLSLRRATRLNNPVKVKVVFLSTLSLRRATNSACCGVRRKYISIHALLAESDLIFTARHMAVRVFLSTLSLRRATVDTPVSVFCKTRISIHALLAESDRQTRHCKKLRKLFLSTLSLRRATQHEQKRAYVDGYFYPRSPCGERLSLILTTI